MQIYAMQFIMLRQRSNQSPCLANDIVSIQSRRSWQARGSLRLLGSDVLNINGPALHGVRGGPDSRWAFAHANSLSVGQSS
jgi:hypothetical protein